MNFLFISFYFSQFPFENFHFYYPIVFEFFFGLFQLYLLCFFIYMISLHIPIFYFIYEETIENKYNVSINDFSKWFKCTKCNDVEIMGKPNSNMFNEGVLLS